MPPRSRIYASTKRKSSVDDLRVDQDDDEAVVASTPTVAASKRSKTDINLAAATSNVDAAGAAREKIMAILESIKAVKDDAGKSYFKIFNSLPPRHLYADYYDVITRPIALNIIRGKADAGEYTSLQEFREDVELMVANARHYNEKGSVVYEDAGKLMKLVQAGITTAKRELAAMSPATPAKPAAPLSKREKASAATPVPKSAHTPTHDVDAASFTPVAPRTLSLEEKILSVLEQVEATPTSPTDNSPRYAMFRALPTKEQHSDYLRVITSPMSLEMIRDRALNGAYSSLDDFKSDIDLIVANARNYHRPSSDQHHLAVEMGRAAAALIATASRRPRSSKAAASAQISATTGANASVSAKNKGLATDAPGSPSTVETPSKPPSSKKKRRDPDDFARAPAVSARPTEPEDPAFVRASIKAVLLAIDDAMDDGSQPFYQVFQELPPREDYPDYYQLIKRPIALDIIKRKFEATEYTSISEFKDDMYLLAFNARRYNAPGSRIYDDADELKKLMNRILATEQRKAKTKGKDEPEEESDAEETPEQVYEKSIRILEEINAVTDDNGDAYYEAFHELPPVDDFPDYYQFIKRPIALANIRDKVEKKQYSALAEFVADIDLMVTNAKRYNELESAIVISALELQRMVHKIAGIKKLRRRPPVESTPTTRPMLKLKMSEPALKLKLTMAGEEMEPPTDEDYDKAFKTISNANYKILEQLIVNPHFDPNKLRPAAYEGDSFTCGLIHAAARRGRPRGITLLMSRGADADLRDTWHGGTALAYAAFFGHINVAKLLIEQYKADRFATNLHGQIPWEFVANRRDREWIRLLKPPNEPTPEPESDVDMEDYESQGELSDRDTRKRKSSGGRMRGGDADDHPGPKYTKRLTWAESYRLRQLNKGINDWLQILIEHREPDGRAPAEEFMDLHYDEDVEKPLSLNYMLEHVAYYRSLKEFEDDVALMFSNVKAIYGADSQMALDASALHKIFLDSRQEIYSKGPKLEKRVLMASLAGLEAELELLTPTEGLDRHEIFIFEDQEYGVGDFVYVTEKKDIVMVDRMFTDPDGMREAYLVARPFYYPSQIKAVRESDRKLSEQEVFRGTMLKEYKFTDIVGRCHVMFHKDYLVSFPQGFNYEDIYVCICRFAETAKNQFPYISNWRQAIAIEKIARPVTMIQRPSQIKLTRLDASGLPIGSGIGVSGAAHSDNDDGSEIAERMSKTPAKKYRPVKTPGQYLQSPEGSMVYYQPVEYDFVTPSLATIDPSELTNAMDIGMSSATPATEMAAAATAMALSETKMAPSVPRPAHKLPPLLPKGAKILRAIMIEDVERTKLSLTLAAEPSNYSMDVDARISALRIRPVIDDLQYRYGSQHQPSDAKIYVYQNAAIVPAEAENSGVFTARLAPGLNPVEIWVTYNTQSAPPVPASTGERYTLRAQVPSVTQETQQYSLFIVRH